jgi:hypothetical protein
MNQSPRPLTHRPFAEPLAAQRNRLIAAMRAVAEAKR